MPPKQQMPVGTHSPGLFIGLGIAAAGAATYFGLPGMLLALAGLITAAFQHPGFFPTGPKDKNTGQPTPMDHEKPAMLAYRFWSTLKNSLIIPGRAWMPGVDAQLSWLVAIWVAVLAWHIPTPGNDFLPTLTPYIVEYGPWINALCAFMLIAPTTHFKRQFASIDDQSPGAPVTALVKMAKEAPQKTIALTAVSLVFALMSASLATAVVNMFMPVPVATVWALTITGSFLLFVGPAWRKSSLDHWRKVVAARREWEHYWDYDKKVDARPRLINVEEVGPATVHTYVTDHTNSVDTIFANFETIKAPIDHNLQVAMIDVPLKDEQGQPIPGSVSQTDFKVVIWPPNSAPDWTDPKTPEDVINLYATCCFSWAVSHSPGRPEVETLELVSTEDSPAIWALTWYPRATGGPVSFREGRHTFMGGFGAEILVDHRANGGAGKMYVGACSEGEVDEAKFGNNQSLAEIAEEDDWNEKFIEAMAQGSNAPVPNFGPRVSAKLVNGTQIDSVPFVMRRSQTWELYLKFEQKLGTVLSGSTMCTMVGYPKENGRAGDRRPDAFSLLYSYGQLPARPHELQPNIEEYNRGEKMVLQAMINAAFTATKRLARPEVHRVSCLTTTPEQTAAPTRGRMRGRRGAMRRRRASHIWQIDMRLYDGATLSDVRSMASKIQETLGSPWMRVKEAPDGCSIVVGAEPADVTFASERDEEECMKLDWQNAWHAAKISGNNGRVPQMVSLSTMEDNELVSIIEFALPAPLDYQTVKNADKKLGAITGNEFVEVKRIPGNPSAVQVLCAVDSPIPSMAPYDWPMVKAEIAKKPCAPFATSMSGSMVTYDPLRDVHLMVVGGSGSGKSVTMQSLVTGALASGADIYVGDPTKGATDFFFMQQYAKAFAVTMIDTSAMMRGLYEEVKKRVALLAKHKVANIRDLPPEVRPNFVYLILDEFTGLVQVDKVPPKVDDPDAMSEREDVIFNNLLKTDVGVMTGKIAREARSAGVTLILATQKLDAATLAPVQGGTTLKANMSRLIVGSTSLGDLQAALKNPYNAPSMDGDVPKGRGLFESAGASEPEMIQCYFEPGGQDQMGKYVAELRQPLAEHEKLDLEPHRRIDPNSRTYEDDDEPIIADIDATDLDFDDIDFGDLDFTDGAAEQEASPTPPVNPSYDQMAGMDQEALEAALGFDEEEDEDEDWVQPDRTEIAEPILNDPPPPAPNNVSEPEASASAEWSMDSDPAGTSIEEMRKRYTREPVDTSSWSTPDPQPSPEPSPAPAPIQPLPPLRAPAPPQDDASAPPTANTLLYLGETGPFNEHCENILALGLPMLAASGDTISSDGSRWGQLETLAEWLKSNQQITSVIWIDRQFSTSIDADMLASKVFNAGRIRFLPLGPGSSGVNRKMTEKVKAFLTLQRSQR